MADLLFNLIFFGPSVAILGAAVVLVVVVVVIVVVVVVVIVVVLVVVVVVVIVIVVVAVVVVVVGIPPLVNCIYSMADLLFNPPVERFVLDLYFAKIT